MSKFQKLHVESILPILDGDADFGTLTVNGIDIGIIILDVKMDTLTF